MAGRHTGGHRGFESRRLHVENKIVEDLRQIAQAPLDQQNQHQINRILNRVIPAEVTLDVAAFNSSI